MTSKILSLIFVLSFFFSGIKAQDSIQTSVIEFEKTTHDFGTVKEEGAITYEFKFTNKGKSPIVISNVRASCGCTTPGWTKEPVLPGKSGVITAQYNTVNRPGAFSKNLTVMANTEPAMTMLYIKGNVLAKVKTPEELYPQKMGKIRLFSEHVYLGRITTKEPFSKEITIYNEGPEPVTFSASNLPSHIELSFFPQTIGPKEKTIAKVTYNASKRNELGPVEDKVVFTTDEAHDNKKTLNVSAEINEYYPPLSAEDAANAPKLTFKKEIHDFGTVKVKGSYTAEIEISNPGKQELTLKKIRSGASYVTVKADKTTIKPGQSAVLKITYRAEGKMGLDNQFIWIHSNDPLMPTKNITVKANVIQ
jgi:hypothetical protein